MLVSTHSVMLCCLLVLSTLSLHSQSNDQPRASSVLMSAQQLENLAENRQWLDLLHFHQIGLFSRFESQADNPRFFLSAKGKQDAKAELLALLTALEKSDYADDSAICRFPARTHWLQQQGFLPAIDIDKCQAFSAWRQKLDARSLTLAFPAAYLNSPSSMYGHTFIRINRNKGNNPLLDFSINFAANADPDDNELIFSFKGLTGGYPGIFSVLPYYEKVKEYSFLESRDVWEYDLDLTDDEIQQFIRHVWEVQQTHFDYFFIGENCSYHLLTLLDAASSRFNLARQFKIGAIPADTVRAIKEAGLITQATFRPSTMSLLTHMLKETSLDIQQTARHIVEQDVTLADTLSRFNRTEQAQLLEIAYQYSRYLSVRKKQDQKKQGQKALAILSARSKVDTNQVFSEPPRPAFRDDEGHHSSRLEATTGIKDSNHYLQLGIRAAYHDRLDNAPGYLQGAQLEMLHLRIRHTRTDSANEFSRIEHIGLVDIASYSPGNYLVQPLSWEVSTGLKRPDSAEDQLLPYLSAGWGASSLWFNQHVYALGVFELNIDKDIEHNHHFSAGPKIGWLHQQNNWAINLDFIQRLDLSGARFDHRELSLGTSLRLNNNWQLRINSRLVRAKPQRSTQAEDNHAHSMSVMYYF